MTSTPHTVVIGAGIIGVASALWLKRYGHEVTLVDRNPPGTGTSFGNACVLAACSFVPVTSPGLIQKAPGYLFDKNFPLFLRWSYLPKLTPFLMRYLGHANDTDTRRIAKSLHFITHDSVEQHKALAGNTRAFSWIDDRPYTFAYKDRAAFEADGYAWRLRAEAGFLPDILEGDAVQDYQPALSKDFRFMCIMHDHGFIMNPKEYIDALTKTFQEMGGRLVQSDVKDFEWRDNRVSAVMCAEEKLSCDHTVLATGAFSKALMKKLGLNVPLESERGYHILYKEPSISPTVPIMITTGKFVATPMNAGLRCAGTVEFGGLDAGASRKPLAFMRRTVAKAFPGLEAQSEEEWLGHRPATPDSLPLIGQVRNTGVYAGFGHQHIGLTAGAKTGRVIADMLCGHPIDHDMSPYDANRFSP